jgi:hypothetical protein
MKFESSNEVNYTLEVKDGIGKTLLIAEERKAKRGMNYTDLDLSKLTSGIYFINLRMNSINKMIRITKQ